MAVTYTWDKRNRAMWVVQGDITSDGSGDASTATDTDAPFICGLVVGARIVADGGGTAPSANWDVVVTDAYGIDVLNGNGANLSATAASTLGPSDLKMGMPCRGPLTFTAAQMGASKGALVTLYIVNLARAQ